MRVWDVEPSILCRKHLLGEHREIHALYTILEQGKPGYRHHPETKRWEGKLAALKKRHEAVVAEMEKRGYVHQSPILHQPSDSELQDNFVNTVDEQLDILKAKDCDCPVNKPL